MLNNLYKMAGNFLSPSGARARLSILIYHRILPEFDPLTPYEPTAELFDKQIGELKKVFNLLPVGEAIARLKTSSLPPRAACITFDDGYADNADIALPILQRHGVQACFFIATAYLNGGRMFNDTVIHAIRHSRDEWADLSKLGLDVYDLSTNENKSRAINAILPKIKYLPLGRREALAEELASLISDVSPPDGLMMADSQLLRLSGAGMEIGGHTARHPILAKLSTAEAEREIAEGKEYLEALLRDKIDFFAYPNGKPGMDYFPEQVNIPKKLGFEAALSTQWGTADRNSDFFQIPRYTPYSSNIYRFTPMLLENLYSSGKCKTQAVEVHHWE